MSENLENKATRGSISQIILKALSSGDKYGYEICKDIERLTNGRLILKQPSLYSCLRRMEEQNLITSYWKDSALGGRRHYYSLSEKGKELFENQKLTLKSDTELINNLPENLNYQESQNDDTEKIIFEESTETTFIANQENLFNLTKISNKEIKKINNDDLNEENDNKSFMQFDFFEQNIKLVKNDNKEKQEISTFTNKYSEMDNHSEEIEPEDNKIATTNSTIFSPIQQEEIKREDVFSENLLSSDNEESKEEKDFSDSALDIFEENSPLNTPIEEEINELESNLNTNISVETIEWKQEDSIETEKPVFKNNDYRSLIGKLYNNSQLKDPYEQNKYQTFKEIFPSSQLKITEKNKEETKESTLNSIVESNNNSNIACDDIKMLNNLYNLQGITIKNHNDIENKQQNKVYTDKNKLNMVTSWILCIVMLLEIFVPYYLLKNNNMIINEQKLVYFLGFAVTLTYGIILTLENTFDRFKLVIIEKRFNKIFIPRLLIFIITVVVIFALNLALGMESLTQINFLSFWLIPTLLSSNLLVYSAVYYLLLKSKKFNS